MSNQIYSPPEEDILREMRLYGLDRMQAIYRLRGQRSMMEHIEEERRRMEQSRLQLDDIDWDFELEPENGKPRSKLAVAGVVAGIAVSVGVSLWVLDLLLMSVTGLECLLCA